MEIGLKPLGSKALTAAGVAEEIDINFLPETSRATQSGGRSVRFRAF
jgi:hypothetical protein